MQFPRLVYKNGGSEQRPGGTYSHMCVKNEEDYLVALTNGWSPSLDEAIAPPMPMYQEYLTDDELLTHLGASEEKLDDLQSAYSEKSVAIFNSLSIAPGNIPIPVDSSSKKNSLSVKKNKNLLTK